MKIDPVDAIVSALDSIFVRIIVVCVVCTLGAAFPIAIQYIHGGPILENYIRLGNVMFIFFPFYISTVAGVTGWWALIAGPLAIVLVYRIFMYLKDDVTHVELVNLFTISFYSTLIVVNPHWITGIIVAGALGYLCYRLAKYNVGTRSVL